MNKEYNETIVPFAMSKKVFGVKSNGFSIASIFGTNVQDHLRFCSNANNETFKYFHYGCSPVWNAIIEHVKKSPAGKCCLFNNPYGIDPNSISFKSAFAYNPESTIQIEFFVTSFRKDDELQYNEDYDEYGEEIEDIISVYFPADLELNFTQAKFDKWLKEKGRSLKKRSHEAFLADLDKLMERYPNQKSSLTKAEVKKIKASIENC